MVDTGEIMIKRLLKMLFGTKKETITEVVQMITFEELQKVSDPIEGEYIDRTNIYLDKINVFRKECDIPMIATSFYRSKDHQIEIYKKKAKNKQFPFADGVFNLKKVPLKSKHLVCEACDFADADKRIARWVKEHIEWCEENGFYFEDFDSTPTWAHIQITPPRSGKTIFKP